MRLPRLVAVVAFTATLLAGASAQVPPSPRTWSRTYGGASDAQGLFDVRAVQGKVVVAGYTGSFPGGTPFHWLLNLDGSTGDVLLQQVSSGVPAGVCDGGAVAADGGALFLGRTVVDFFVKHDAWALRVGPTGQALWSRRFATPGAGRFFLFDAAELADGSWIGAGSAGITDQPPQAAWLVRLSAAGDVLWSWEYGAGVAESASAVVPTPDGGFAVAGWTTSSGAGGEDAWVLKVDDAGTIQWQKTFGGADADKAAALVALPDGSFAVAGETNSLTSSGHAPWVLRLDAAGNLLWHAAVASDVWGDLGDVARTADGQLVVVGRVGEPGFPSNDVWAAKLAAADGKVQWQRAYDGNQGDFGSAVFPLGRSGYLLGGTAAWGFAGESVWVQRTDRAGNLSNCTSDRTTSFSLLSPAVGVAAGKAVRKPGTAQVQAGGARGGPSAAQVSEICP